MIIFYNSYYKTHILEVNLSLDGIDGDKKTGLDSVTADVE